MTALLIHFLGHLYVDSAVPPYVGSADAYFLAVWYLAFAAVDLIALSFATNRYMRIILSISVAWSIALSIETLLLMDGLQSQDWFAQLLIDGSLMLWLIVDLHKALRPKTQGRTRQE